VIAAKTAEFWGSTKRFSYETVDDYYNGFQELPADLDDAEEPILKRSAIHHFPFTLGSEIEPLQHNYRLGTIAEEWKIQDWPTLLVLCRDFYNLVNPKALRNVVGMLNLIACLKVNAVPIISKSETGS